MEVYSCQPTVGLGKLESEKREGVFRQLYSLIGMVVISICSSGLFSLRVYFVCYVSFIPSLLHTSFLRSSFPPSRPHSFILSFHPSSFVLSSFHTFLLPCPRNLVTMKLTTFPGPVHGYTSQALDVSSLSSRTLMHTQPLLWANTDLGRACWLRGRQTCMVSLSSSVPCTPSFAFSATLSCNILVATHGIETPQKESYVFCSASFDGSGVEAEWNVLA
ncbi:hypothetical protein BDQ17DRAFT_692119 [Cyathus striatus]|nr:hypothetical protein BDQ17DRAFT_692119 [Cyathus striatus]